MKLKRVFLMFVTCCFCLLCACSSNQAKQNESAITPINSKEDSNKAFQPEFVTSLDKDISKYVWKNYSKSHFPFPIGYKVDAATVANSNIIFLGHNETEYRVSVSEYKVDAFSEVFIQAPEYYLTGEELSIEQADFCGLAQNDGIIYILFRDGSEGSVFKLLSISTDGCTAQNICTFNLQSENIRGIAVYENSLVVFGSQLEILDLNSMETSIIGLEDELDYIWSVSNTEKGLIVYSAIQGNLLLDNSNKTLTPLEGATFNLCVSQGYDGEYIQYDLQSIYEYDFEEKQSSKLFDYDTGNLPGDMPTFVCRLSDKSFVFVSERTDTVVVAGACLGEKAENEIVNVAILNDQNDSGKLANSKIITSSDMISEYKYVVTEYNYSELTRLITEISTDNSPDLILFREGIDTSSNYFENLYDYMDNDRWISRESIVGSFLSAMEVDGELHEIWPTFGVTTVGIRYSDYDPNSEFTTDYCDFVMREKKYKSVFGSFMTAENLLRCLAEISTGAYIDKVNATCDFTTEGFGKILEWCNKMDLGIVDGKTTDIYEVEEVLLSLEKLVNTDRLIYIPEIFGQELVFVGFPNAPGNGSYFENPGISMAIPVNSSNKEGAWAFIRNQLVIESQLSTNNIRNGFPVNRQALERRVGNSLNQKTAGDFLQLVNNTEKAISYSDQQIRDVIMECGYDYLDNKKSLEEIIKVIQSRIGVLVAEKYG